MGNLDPEGFLKAYGIDPETPTCIRYHQSGDLQVLRRRSRTEEHGAWCHWTDMLHAEALARDKDGQGDGSAPGGRLQTSSRHFFPQTSPVPQGHQRQTSSGRYQGPRTGPCHRLASCGGTTSSSKRRCHRSLKSLPHQSRGKNLPTPTSACFLTDNSKQTSPHPNRRQTNLLPRPNQSQ
jgi:hypothetical protein